MSLNISGQRFLKLYWIFGGATQLCWWASISSGCSVCLVCLMLNMKVRPNCHCACHFFLLRKNEKKINEDWFKVISENSLKATINNLKNITYRNLKVSFYYKNDLFYMLFNHIIVLISDNWPEVSTVIHVYITSNNFWVNY